MSSDSLVRLIQQEIQADAVFDDCTTSLLAQTSRLTQGVVFTKQVGVFAGTRIVQGLSQATEGKLELRCLVKDGDSLAEGDKLVELEGSAAHILGFERTLLNLLSHACGIATQTRAFVEAAKPYGTQILATRKTLPGLRTLQLEAVRAGGGVVHRRSLSDGILIKENHQTIAKAEAWIRAAREKRSPLHGIEIEVQDIALLDSVLEQAPDVIMLDNMSPECLEQAVLKIGKRARIEVSGGVRIEDVPAIAKLGVHYISVGRLTHSVTALDLSLDMAL